MLSKLAAAELKMVPQFSRLVGSCEKLNEIKRKILMVADTDTPLIFLGESGTGKTLAAQIAHELSPRKNKPFITANMANGNKELFESQFPAQFISEAVDQTRGWFYSLMAESTLLFNKSPYENVIVLGLVLDETARR